MSVVDPIADMLARVRNAHQALHANCVMPTSKMKEALAAILKEEGYIIGYAASDGKLDITLKYERGKPLISGLKKISKPGRRVFVGATEIPKVQNGLGISILSTSSGIMAGSAAGEKNIGGELICEIW